MNIFKLFEFQKNSALTEDELLEALKEIKNNSGEILRTMENKIRSKILHDKWEKMDKELVSDMKQEYDKKCEHEKYYYLRTDINF